MNYHLTFGEDLSINYHFIGRTQEQFRDVVQLMGLNRGSVAGQSNVYFIHSSNGDQLSDMLDRVATACGIRYPEKNWIGHDIRYGTAWECYKHSAWLICSTFERGSFKEGYSRGLRIWTSLLIGFPTVMVAQQNGGVLFHAALVSHHGRGIAISAKGGIGKTTTCRRLPESWRVHADDQVLLMPQKNRGLTAHALPTWSAFWDGEPEFPLNIPEPIPLKAFVYLNQARQNTLKPLNKSHAVSSLFLGVVHMSRLYWRFMERSHKKAWADEIITRCRLMAENRPSWHLELSLTGAFWNDMERLLLS